MDSLNSRKPALWVLNKFLRISEYAYGGVVDLLIDRNVSVPISIVLNDNDFKAAKDICRDIASMYKGFSTEDVKHINITAHHGTEISKSNFIEMCLKFNLVDGSNKVNFNVFRKGSQLMNFMFAHNYVAIRLIDGIPELFMLDNTSKKRKYSLLNVLKNPNKLSDIAENWCNSFSDYSWKNSHYKFVKETYEKYLNDFGKKRDMYEEVKKEYRNYDKLFFYRVLTFHLANSEIQLPAGQNCRFITLGELRKIGLLDVHLPHYQPDRRVDAKGEPWKDFSTWSSACDIADEKRENSITDALKCPICRENCCLPFQYMNDDTDVIIIGAEIFHTECVDEITGDVSHDAFLDVRVSLDNMDKVSRKRYDAIDDDVLTSIGIVKRDYSYEEPGSNDIYSDAVDKFVFNNPILLNSNAKIFGGFIRRYMSADIGFEFNELRNAIADIDIITDKDVYGDFASVSIMSPSQDFVIGRGGDSIPDDKKGFSVRAVHKKKSLRGESGVQIKLDIHSADVFSESRTSKYVSDAFANMFTLDIATGNVSIMRNFEYDDLRMSSLTELETFSLALETTLRGIYMLKQAIPKHVTRLYNNHLRRIYKPLQMQMSGWLIDYSYVEWQTSCYTEFLSKYGEKHEYDIKTGKIITLDVFKANGTCIFCKKPSYDMHNFDFEQCLDMLLSLECGHSICLRCLYFGKQLHKLVDDLDYYDVSYDECKQMIRGSDRGGDYKHDLCPEKHTGKCTTLNCYHYDCIESSYVRLHLTSG